ncbi:alpha/beta hydrolase [Pigmentiphaga soli]|uniref:Alpha/beta hydrolase n=1 Tax=Pigmentiphaga soli TaxID=1007095 RepID=A0ABP8GFG7_9BURK
MQDPAATPDWTARRLDPSAQALIDQARSLGLPPVHAIPVVQARENSRRARELQQPEAPAVRHVADHVVDRDTAPLRVRHYRARDTAQPQPCLVYFHGGGFIQGDLESHDVFCRQLSVTLDASVIAVDYRLAPEHPFPAAVTDAVDAVSWAFRHALPLGIDPERLAVGGDSAGANLATVAALTLAGLAPPIVAQLLLYPVADQSRDHPSRTECAEGYVLTRRALDYYASLYFTDAAQRRDWRASPLLCPDLSRLPPTLVVTAGFDPLRDEGQAYARRMAKAGVRVDHYCYDGQIHGFATRSKDVPEALDAIARSARFLRARWGTAPT